MEFTENEELKAKISNKLQGVYTALEFLSKGKELPQEFLVKAYKGLKEAEKLLRER